MVKYILCECGKRYLKGNQKHFNSIEHLNFINNKKNNECNEMHLIVYDIDKNKLIEYLKNNCSKKRKLEIKDDKIIDYDDVNDKDYNPSDNECTDSDDGENLSGV